MRLKKHPEYPANTKYDGLAQFLYRKAKPRNKKAQPFWKNLKLKEKDYWRGMSQIQKENL